MPMSPAGYFLYAVMVVLMWGSPFILAALWLGWRRRKLAKALLGILVAVPATAGVGVLAFAGSAGLGAELHSVKYARFQERVNEAFGPLPAAVAVRGRDDGIVRRGGDDYRRLVFSGVWPDDPNRQLEVWWPEDKGTPVVGAVREPLAPDAGRRLWLVLLRPPHTQYSPYGDGQAFMTHLPLAGTGPGAPDVVLHLSPSGWIFRRPAAAVEGNAVWPPATPDIDFDAIAASR